MVPLIHNLHWMTRLCSMWKSKSFFYIYLYRIVYKIKNIFEWTKKKPFGRHYRFGTTKVDYEALCQNFDFSPDVCHPNVTICWAPLLFTSQFFFSSAKWKVHFISTAFMLKCSLWTNWNQHGFEIQFTIKINDCKHNPKHFQAKIWKRKWKCACEKGKTAFAPEKWRLTGAGGVTQHIERQQWGISATTNDLHYGAEEKVAHFWCKGTVRSWQHNLFLWLGFPFALLTRSFSHSSYSLS